MKLERIKGFSMQTWSLICGNGELTGVKGMVALVAGFAAACLGGIDALLKALAVAVVIDYLSGVLKAIAIKKLSSEIGAKGIAKKLLYFVVVALAYLVEQVTEGVVQVREIVIVFYLCNEAISIIENAVDAGVPVPDKLREVLVQLRKKGDGNG